MGPPQPLGSSNTSEPPLEAPRVARRLASLALHTEITGHIWDILISEPTMTYFLTFSIHALQGLCRVSTQRGPSLSTRVISPCCPARRRKVREIRSQTLAGRPLQVLDAAARNVLRCRVEGVSVVVRCAVHASSTLPPAICISRAAKKAPASNSFRGGFCRRSI